MPPSYSVAGRTEALAAPVIAVVRVDAIGSALPGAEAALQPRDRRRLQAARTAKRRRELLAGRWLLDALARHVGFSELAFDAAADGGGIEVDGAPSTTASVSHAGRWIACVLGRRGPVGVDIEPLRERNFLALVSHAFPERLPALERLDGDERKLEFYRLWTCHEARLKNGVDAHACASWHLANEWVLSFSAAGADAAAAPLGWNAVAGGFEPLPATRLQARA